MSTDSSPGDFLAGFMVGALVGAAVAFLFAPQSGEETRTLIREKGIELREQADEMSLEARRKADELQAQTREKAAGLQAQLKQSIDEGKSAGRRSKEELLTTLDEAAETAAEATAEA
jgi:gas vesicle protein